MSDQQFSWFLVRIQSADEQNNYRFHCFLNHKRIQALEKHLSESARIFIRFELPNGKISSTFHLSQTTTRHDPPRHKERKKHRS